MSRSRRYTPIMGITTSRSEKEDKRMNNRKLRRKEKEAVRQGREIMPVMDDVSNPRSMGKDGRQRIDVNDPGAWKWMKK